MARLGLPAITLWQQLGGNDSNFVFYDDNQTMIGVIRTGKNPTMRHLERTHGINIGWMHSIFQEGYVSLAYEVNAKMAADIHTKVVQGLRFLDSRMSADQHLSACPHWFPRDHGTDALHARAKRRREGPSTLLV